VTNLLGLDIGTSGVRCLAVDEKARVVAEAGARYPIYAPLPGWSEQQPEDWW
jgi:xylulokinase